MKKVKSTKKYSFESEKRYRMWRTLAIVAGAVVVICVILLLVLEK